jgi:hypothetical protein
MAKNVSIICDGCGKDITETGAMPAFRLRLSSEPLPSNSNVIFGVLVYSEIKEDKYFCGLNCLQLWVSH